MTVVRGRKTSLRFSSEKLKSLNTIKVVWWLCDLVRCCKTTSHDHGTTSWEGRSDENMWKYGINIHDFKRTTSSDDCTMLNIGHRNQVFEHGQNRQELDVIRGPSMAATSHWYNIARLRTIHPPPPPRCPRSPKPRPSPVIVRCLKAHEVGVTISQIDARSSHNVVTGRMTNAQDIHEKAVQYIYLFRTNVHWKYSTNSKKYHNCSNNLESRLV